MPKTRAVLIFPDGRFRRLRDTKIPHTWEIIRELVSGPDDSGLMMTYRPTGRFDVAIDGAVVARHVLITRRLLKHARYADIEVYVLHHSR